MTVVAITGASRGLGAHLLSQVQCDPEVSRVVAIDDEPPAPDLAQDDRVVFVRRTPAQSWEDVFREHGVVVAIHAGLSEPLRDRAREEAVNLGGTRRFLEACHAAGARIVCFVSSAAAYGAAPDNADYMFEGAPLRPPAGFPHAVDAARAEALCYEYVASHPDVCLQIVRVPPVVGPSVARSFWTRLLERRLLLAPWGHEPVLQLVHEDDATRALWRLVKQQRIGVFNVAGDGYVTLTQVARLFGGRVVRLPTLLLRLVAWLAWRLGGGEVPPAFVDYLLHPWLINPTKIKADAMFVFRYDTPRALLDWVEARDEAQRGRRGLVAAPIDDDVEDLDDDDEVFEDDDAPLDDAALDAALDAVTLPPEAEAAAPPTQPAGTTPPEPTTVESAPPAAAEPAAAGSAALEEAQGEDAAARTA
ncbi:MAG: NAD-dependent epimerase/dehydratase family protein [Planctomycetes bacterium]|nr:NAD-dependent epimerase/dehydratase family protein [Planctomycetota bacterium]